MRHLSFIFNALVIGYLVYLTVLNHDKHAKESVQEVTGNQFSDTGFFNFNSLENYRFSEMDLTLVFLILISVLLVRFLYPYYNLLKK